jgi:arylsulfatase A-like enzyme
LEGDDLKREKYQRYIHDYLRCVKANDENVGRILDYLEESGLAENTIVCYSSDQSFYLGEHGWYDKRFMYHQSFSTPLLVRWPGQISPGTQVNALVQNIDMAPTFLSIGGASIPDSMHGIDLTPVMDGAVPKDWRKSLYYHFYESDDPMHKVSKHEGVYDGRYKLIHFYEIGEWEFFDREIDPYELENRINDRRYLDTIGRMKKELKRLKNQYEVEVP